MCVLMTFTNGSDAALKKIDLGCLGFHETFENIGVKNFVKQF